MRKSILLGTLLAATLCSGTEAQAQEALGYSSVITTDGLTDGGRYVLKYTGSGGNGKYKNKSIYEEAEHTCVNNNSWQGPNWNDAEPLGENPGILRFHSSASTGTPAFTSDDTQYFFTLEAGDNGTYAIKAASGNYVDGRDLSEVVSGKGVPVHTVDANTNKSYFTFTFDANNNGWNISNGNASGRRYLSAGDVDNGCATMWNQAASWQIYAVSDTPANVTVTYQVDLGGSNVRTYNSESVATGIGLLVTAPTLPFLTLAEGQPTSVEVTEEGQQITFTYVQALPFEVTTGINGSFPADTKWYGIDMHSNQNNFTWQDSADDSRVLTPVTAKALATGLPYEQQFCFAGNIIDGFKIYNHAAGATMTLGSTDDTPTLTTNGTDNVWKLTASNASNISGTIFCLQQSSGTKYLNHASGNFLQYGNAADNGSTCRVFPAASFSYNYLLPYTGAPAGAVGTLTDNELTAKATAAVAEYEAYKFDSNHFADILSNVAKAVAANDTVAFVPGGYYRLANAEYTDSYIACADGANNLTGNTSATAALTEPGTVFRFEPVDGQTGQYRLMVQSRYVSTTRGNTNVALTDAASAVAYTLSKTDATGRFHIKDVTGGNQAYFNLNDNRNVLGGFNNKDASRWYLLPATELEVSLHSAEDGTWASLHLPFGVELPKGLTAYTGTRNDVDKTVTLSAINAVPANTGVILQGSEETYTLTIADVTATVEDNAFSGTNVQITGIEKGSYYTLGYGDNGLGLYHPNTTTIPANVAFIAGSAQGIQGYRLSIGDGTTGIEAVETTGSNAPAVWYDLSGRRVTAPAKGIYIRNGQKVLVR